MKKEVKNRRSFLKDGAFLILGTSVLTDKIFPSADFRLSNRKFFEIQEKEEKVSPVEDLMREHGLLNRVLLIYDNILNKLKGYSDFPPEVLSGSAQIIKDFIENYHEKLEEDNLFTRFRKAGKMTDLVDVLEKQHDAGRKITEYIIKNSNKGLITDKNAGRNMQEKLQAFLTMYRPHEAREDTVLFPAFKSLLDEKEYDSLGEKFEDKEHELFGENGFEKMVDKVKQLEETLGIYNLAQFTPKA